MDLGISGLASGFDWRAFIEQVSDIERAPQRRLLDEQSRLEQQNIAYGGLVTQLNVLKNRIDVLKEPSFFDTRRTVLDDATAATATADTTAAFGSYEFDFTQLATTSAQRGTSNAGHRLSDSANVDSLAIAAAPFATAISLGTFTVNARQVTIEDGDTLGEVFTKINAATGNVTATYDETTDTINLTASGGGNVVLGSATDTSNFLQVARLFNNGTNTVTSAAALGAVQQSKVLSQANFDTAVAGGVGGAGSFKINGISIAFNATTDTVGDVLGRINASTAGVTATYDSINDRFLLANKTTGDIGIALEDVTGNFLAATGLAGGSLDRGRNLQYTINGGGTLTSFSNSITAASSGISGLTVTALKEGLVQVDVVADTTTIKSAITGFITEYNKTQGMIDAHTASTTDAKGKVTAGILAGHRDASELASKLRSMVNGVVGGLTGPIKQLAALGISSNGTDDTIVLKNASALDSALANNLSAVKAVFSQTTTGIAVSLSGYLERSAGDDGSLVTLQGTLDRQSDSIDDQVADLERMVLANQERLINSFVAMEKAQAKVNQQLQFLSQRFSAAAS